MEDLSVGILLSFETLVAAAAKRFYSHESGMKINGEHSKSLHFI